MDKFCERLKELREDLNLTQDALAKATGYSQSAIAFWEKGVKKPNFYAIIKLAEYFEVTTDYLFGLSDDK